MSNYEQFRLVMKDAGFALSSKPVTKKILENAIQFSKSKENVKWKHRNFLGKAKQSFFLEHK